MFSHVTRTMAGMVLRTLDLARDCIGRTTTTTGLHVLAEIARKTYEKGRQVARDFLHDMPILFNDFLPELNYTALPR
jgi:hypothetical protein